ncbi:MAG TPA: outer membrane protein assembly factor BamD [Bryobacterales bacterium]|jgi:outer membrane protein assembly factor BamD|nr:outer membrane protein assembly factor BamD [Bryobacterales bacterium]
MHATVRKLIVLVAAAAALTGCARRKKYENPIITNSQQPDKVLFDRAIGDIERSRFEVARLTLQTLINTYPDSEYIAKAKLAIADSWYRQGGTNGLAQAEAEYKDFITFFPTMEEAAESQKKVCQIHYQQMEKPDRDPQHAIKAEAECRQFLVQFPNSKFVPQVEQMLREIQEVRAEAEFRVGQLYAKKGSYRAAATRLAGLTEQYPLYSKADEALWVLGDAYGRMGKNFEDKSARAYSRLVREYPLSAYAPDAKDRLSDMKRPIPDPDQNALARMQYELENRETTGVFGHAFGIFSRKPDVKAAAKTGKPSLVAAAPVIPEGVNVAAPATGTATAEVGAQTITGPSALDTQPDARSRPPAAATPAPTTGDPGGSAASTASASATGSASAAATNEVSASTASSSGETVNGSAPSTTSGSAGSSKKKKKGRFLKIF